MLAGMNVPSNLDVPAHSANAITIWYTTHISQLKQTVQHVVWQTKCFAVSGMESIQSHLAEKKQAMNDKVCFSCYKSQLQMLKHSKSNSINTDLDEIIQVVK